MKNLARIINYTLGLETSSPKEPQFAGVQGEQNATKLNIVFDSDLQEYLQRALKTCDYISYSVDVEDGAGDFIKGTPTTLTGYAGFVYPLGTLATAVGGTLNIMVSITAVSIDADGVAENQFVLTYPVTLYFKDFPSIISGGIKTAADISPAVTEARKLRDDVYDMSEEVGEMVSSVESQKDDVTSLVNSATELKNQMMQAYADYLSSLGTDVATLVNGKIPANQIPAIATTEIYVVSSDDEMNALSAETGDICIRSDLKRSYICSDGQWVYFAAPDDYAATAGYADQAGSAENANKINNHRLVEISAENFATAVKDENTYYLVVG